MKAKSQSITRRARRGQGMTEYIIIVSLIAIAAIGVITLFGNNIRALFGASAQALAGTPAVETRDGAAHQELRQKNMQNAFQNNGY